MKYDAKEERTAWYDEKDLPQGMLDSMIGNEKWSKLEDTEHFLILDEMIKISECKSMADVGCGAGEVGRIYGDNIEYVGFDLPHIVEKVSKVLNSSRNFVHFDSNKNDFSTLSKFDLILCSGFISELTNLMETIEKILSNAKDFVIIHRQSFDKSSNFTKYTTYAGLETTRANIGRDEFMSLLTEKKFKILSVKDGLWGSSVLMKKAKNK